jgi:hypothetical protein
MGILLPCTLFLCTAGSSSDNVYFAANYKSTDPRSYDISYQHVNISNAGESAMTSRLYGWQEGDEFWLSCESIINLHQTWKIYIPNISENKILVGRNIIAKFDILAVLA